MYKKVNICSIFGQRCLSSLEELPTTEEAMMIGDDTCVTGLGHRCVKRPKLVKFVMPGCFQFSTNGFEYDFYVYVRQCYMGILPDVRDIYHLTCDQRNGASCFPGIYPVRYEWQAQICDIGSWHKCLPPIMIKRYFLFFYTLCISILL